MPYRRRRDLGHQGPGPAPVPGGTGHGQHGPGPAHPGSASALPAGMGPNLVKGFPPGRRGTKGRGSDLFPPFRAFFRGDGAVRFSGRRGPDRLRLSGPVGPGRLQHGPYRPPSGPLRAGNPPRPKAPHSPRPAPAGVSSRGRYRRRLLRHAGSGGGRIRRGQPVALAVRRARGPRSGGNPCSTGGAAPTCRRTFSWPTAGRRHDSGRINRGWVEAFLAGRNRQGWVEANRAVLRLASALKARDWEGAAGCLRQEMDIRRNITPDALVPETRTLIDVAEAEGCGARFTGAGGGGTVWAIGSRACMQALKTRWGRNGRAGSRGEGAFLPHRFTGSGVG